MNSNPFDYIPSSGNWRYRPMDDFGSINSPPSWYNRTRTQNGFPHSRLLEEPADRYNRNRRQPGFPPPEEPLSFQVQNPGFQYQRFSSQRRVIAGGGPLGFNSMPQGPLHGQTRVLVFEDVVPGNALPTRQFHRPDRPSPPPPPPPQHLMRRLHNNRPSSTNESRLTTEEQCKVLSKLRKEKYNPGTRTSGPNLKNRHDTTLQERDENWKRCAVCLEDFEAGEEVALTPCDHMFHEECIVPWVKKEGSCPVCRFMISERVNESSARETAPPRHADRASPPAVDSDLLAVMRALMADDDFQLQNMIPVMLGR